MSRHKMATISSPTLNDLSRLTIVPIFQLDKLDFFMVSLLTSKLKTSCFFVTVKHTPEQQIDLNFYWIWSVINYIYNIFNLNIDMKNIFRFNPFAFNCETIPENILQH